MTIQNIKPGTKIKMKYPQSGIFKKYKCHIHAVLDLPGYHDSPIIVFSVWYKHKQCYKQFCANYSRLKSLNKW